MGWEARHKTETDSLYAERQRTLKECRRHLTDTLKDRGLLLAIVSGGIHEYRKVMKDAFSAYPGVTEPMVDEMFAYLQSRAGESPNKAFDRWQRADSDAWANARKYQGTN